MNRYTRIKVKRLARFERCGGYLIIVTPDELGVCWAHTVKMNHQ